MATSLSSSPISSHSTLSIPGSPKSGSIGSSRSLSPVSSMTTTPSNTINSNNAQHILQRKQLTEDEYFSIKLFYFQDTIIPQLYYMLNEARQRYDFLVKIHTVHRLRYLKRSYWSSWMGLFVALLAGTQQAVMILTGQLSSHGSVLNESVINFTLSTFSLILGLWIQSAAKIIKQSAQFTQSLNEQIYSFADFIEDKKGHAFLKIHTHEMSKELLANFLEELTIEEMEEEMKKIQTTLNQLSYSTSKIIETFDSELSLYTTIPFSTQIWCMFRKCFWICNHRQTRGATMGGRRSHVLPMHVYETTSPPQLHSLNQSSSTPFTKSMMNLFSQPRRTTLLSEWNDLLRPSRIFL